MLATVRFTLVYILVSDPEPPNIKIHRITILAVFSYWCEILPSALRKEQVLKMSENRMLKLVRGYKIVEVTGERRKLHYVKAHNLYSSPNIRWSKQGGCNEQNM
jgi:hypothetical protein